MSNIRRASSYWITFSLQLARKAGLEITADQASMIGLALLDARAEAYAQGLQDAKDMPGAERTHREGVRERFGHRQRPVETSGPTTDEHGRTLYYTTTINNLNVIPIGSTAARYTKFLPNEIAIAVLNGTLILEAKERGEVTELRAWLPAVPSGA